MIWYDECQSFLENQGTDSDKTHLEFLVHHRYYQCCFFLVGVRIISDRIVGEAQEKVRNDLNVAREIFVNKLNSGAAVIATAYPLCQINLECYQTPVNEEFGTDFSMPVLYFTQLLGLALGIPRRRLGIGRELVFAAPIFPS